MKKKEEITEERIMQMVELLLKTEIEHPNAFNLFEAYGILCLQYYKLLRENITEEMSYKYNNSMIFLNEAYLLICKERESC